MKKFWKTYSWIYLGALVFGIFYNVMKPIKIKTELTPTQYIIAYILASLFWLIPAIGLFLYSFNKRKFIILWKLLFIYFAYDFAVMIIEVLKTGSIPLLLPFHTVALVGLFLYSFTRK